MSSAEGNGSDFGIFVKIKVSTLNVVNDISADSVTSNQGTIANFTATKLSASNVTIGDYTAASPPDGSIKYSAGDIFAKIGGSWVSLSTGGLPLTGGIITGALGINTTSTYGTSFTLNCNNASNYLICCAGANPASSLRTYLTCYNTFGELSSYGGSGFAPILTQGQFVVGLDPGLIGSLQTQAFQVHGSSWLRDNLTATKAIVAQGGVNFGNAHASIASVDGTVKYASNKFSYLQNGVSKTFDKSVNGSGTVYNSGTAVNYNNADSDITVYSVTNPSSGSYQLSFTSNIHSLCVTPVYDPVYVGVMDATCFFVQSTGTLPCNIWNVFCRKYDNTTYNGSFSWICS